MKYCSRSLAGAWIETENEPEDFKKIKVAPLAGVWVEIEIQKSGKEMTVGKLVGRLGKNATYFPSKALADGVADYYEDVKNAELLSKHIVYQIRRYLRCFHRNRLKG